MQFATGDLVKQFTAEGASLSLLGQTLSGEFLFRQSDQRGGAGAVRMGATNVSLNFGTGGATLLSVTNGHGALLLEAGALAGEFGGDVALNVPDVNFSGNLEIAINTGGAAVNEMISVGSDTESDRFAGGTVFAGARIGRAIADARPIVGRRLLLRTDDFDGRRPDNAVGGALGAVLGERGHNECCFADTMVLEISW